MKVAGRWRYVYLAIDQFGQVIDVFVSPRRDMRAARRCFERAIGTTKTMPSEIVTDQDRSARVVIAGHALLQNVRRGHYELAVEAPVIRRGGGV